MTYILTAAVFVGGMLIAWITQRGAMDAEADYQKRLDDARAERLVAQVRKELAEKGKHKDVSDDKSKG